MLLIDYARNEVGMPIRALYRGKHMGWTTDEQKAESMSAAGARVAKVETENGRVVGWEVSFPVEAELDAS